VSDFADLARRALRERGYSMKSAARAMNYDPAYLSRVLNRRQICSPALAMALDKLLGMNGSLASTVLSRDDRERVKRVSANPSRLDAATVEALAEVLAAYRRLDDVSAPRTLIPGVVRQVREVTNLLREAPESHRERLTEVASEWCQFTGWLLFQVRRHSDAERLLGDAVILAREVGNGPLTAQALHYRGGVARQRKDIQGAIDWYGVEAHTPGTHPAQQISATLRLAEAIVIRDRNNALRLMDKAEVLRSRATSFNAPTFSYWLTPEWSHFGMGSCNQALGRYRDAADHFRAGLAALPERFRGSYWVLEWEKELQRAESLC
jgi:tetratricopeptide (TPR) repeat protein